METFGSPLSYQKLVNTLTGEKDGNFIINKNIGSTSNKPKCFVTRFANAKIKISLPCYV